MLKKILRFLQELDAALDAASEAFSKASYRSDETVYWEDMPVQERVALVRMHAEECKPYPGGYYPDPRCIDKNN